MKTSKTWSKFFMLLLVAGMTASCGPDNKIFGIGGDDGGSSSGVFSTEIVTDSMVKAFQDLSNSLVCSYTGDGTEKVKRLISVRIPKINPGQKSQDVTSLGVTSLSQISTANANGVYFATSHFGSAMLVNDYSQHLEVFIIACLASNVADQLTVNRIYNSGYRNNYTHCRYYETAMSVYYQYSNGSTAFGNFYYPSTLVSFAPPSHPVTYDHNGAVNNAQQSYQFCQ